MKHFLELRPVLQQEWLRKIPADELPALQERTFSLDPADRLKLLSLLRDKNAPRSRSQTRATMTPDEFDGPSRGLMREAARPYVEEDFGAEVDGLAMSYANDDYLSAPPTPASGHTQWRSPVTPIAEPAYLLGDSAGGEQSEISKKRKTKKKNIEPTREELLQGLVGSNLDSVTGTVVVLTLVGVGLDFQLSELAAVLVPGLQVMTRLLNAHPSLFLLTVGGSPANRLAGA